MICAGLALFLRFQVGEGLCATFLASAVSLNIVDGSTLRRQRPSGALSVRVQDLGTTAFGLEGVSANHKYVGNFGLVAKTAVIRTQNQLGIFNSERKHLA